MVDKNFNITFFLFSFIPIFIIPHANAENIMESFEIGGRVGGSWFITDCTSNYSCDRNDYGYNLYSGVELTKNVNLELGFTELGESESVYESHTAIGSIDKFDLSVLYYIKKYHYFRGGVSRWSAEVKSNYKELESENGESFLFGYGYKKPLLDNLLVNIDLQYTAKIGDEKTTGVTDNLFASVGLSWKPFYSQPENQMQKNVEIRPSLEVEPTYEVPDVQLQGVIQSDDLNTVKEKEKLTEVFFAFDSFELSPTQKSVIEDSLEQIDSIKSIVIVGHTDPIGTDLYNLNLSKRRAESVKQVLLSLVDGSEISIEIIGKGSSEPKYKNYINLRRVDVIYYFIESDNK